MDVEQPLKEYVEQACVFGHESPLIGVVTEPKGNQPIQGSVSVIIIGAGLQHKVGSYRVHVRIARALAAEGVPVLRFDFSGIGDSEARRDGLPVAQSAIQEIQRAMDWMTSRCGTGRFVLVGGCLGAVRAFETAKADSRVQAVALLNPPGFGREMVDWVQTRGYWRLISGRPRSWLKTISGSANYRLAFARLKGMFKGIRKSRLAREEGWRQLKTLLDSGTGVMLVVAGNDRSATDVRRWLEDRVAAGQYDNLRVETIERAVHSLSTLETQDRWIDLIRRWVVDREEPIGTSNQR